jgi:glycosyltransferase involved in cell wall biosynthesis
MKIHVLGIPHTKTTDEFTTCAFTMKVRNLCRMMHRRGHTVIHYGTEGSDPECTEHVSVVTDADWRSLYCHPGTGYYDLNTDGKYAPYHAKWAASARKALLERMGKPHEDILCLTWGGTQRTACEGVPQNHVESGIGYRHSWSNYRVYESYAWLHMQLGEAGLFSGNKFYWCVIPNAFDLEMFDFNPEARGDELLYMGRLNEDKGVGLAVHVAREAGLKIALVGPGNPQPFLKDNPHARYLPPAGVEERRKLMAGARAVLCPTLYVEPFCGVHVEAQLSGTPVITTDWGAFSEGVLHGITGYRCRTFEQFVWAAKNVHRLEPAACREWAEGNFSLERVALQYEEYFQQVLNVGRNNGGRTGFYLPHPDRAQLEWLQRTYPREAFAVPDLAHPHVPPPPDPPPPPPRDEWVEAQDFERHWWGLDWAPNWDEELKKQEGYFRLMGFPTDKDFGSKTILDVGCGPVSVLQRSKHGPARGVDPLAVADHTLKRYADADVEFLNIKAEDMPVDKTFDEVWMYNCLQHTADPHAILGKIALMGRQVRIFEWIDLGVCPGHPQNLTEEMFWKHFGTKGWERPIWNTGTLRDFGGTVTNKYIAIHAIRKAPSGTAPGS